MLSRGFGSSLRPIGLSHSQCRFLAFTPMALGVSPYLLFVKEASKRPELKGLPVTERGKMMGRWYKELSQEALAKLKTQAEKTATPPRKQRGESKKVRKTRTTITSYGIFITRNANRPEFQGLPVAERGKRMAVMYKALPPAEIEKLKAEAAAESKKRAAAAANNEETKEPKKRVPRAAPASKPKATPAPAAAAPSSKDDAMEI